MNPIKQTKERLIGIVRSAYERAVADGALPPGAPEVTAEIPKERAHGDFSSPFCMQAARALKLNPRAIAAEILKRADLSDGLFASIDALGAGFLNVRVTDQWYAQALDAAEDDNYGENDLGGGKTVMVEFVSANPTGPMTIGNARGGVLGDALASVLQKSGWKVTREFYLNDAGNQVDKFARSLKARYDQIFDPALPFPEDGYQGEDITALAKAYHEKTAKSDVTEQELCDYALPLNIAKMSPDLKRYGIVFDNWFRESDLHASGYVEDTINLLISSGHTFERDGALWLRATAFGCEKDEVLRRANGFYTYYAVDIAYHRNKFSVRNFDRVINVLGADHHGHILRFKAGVAAIGVDPARLDFVMVQFVNLLIDGKIARVSKRTGKVITLGDLLDEIPRDSARFFFNNRTADTHVDFDMELAARQDSDNPVYYIQYAHARICSLLSLLGAGESAKGIERAALLCDEHERELIRQLAHYPEMIECAEKNLDPSLINAYLIELANAFHRFYNSVRLRGAEESLLNARASLCAAVRKVLKDGLELLGLDAPTHM